MSNEHWKMEAVSMEQDTPKNQRQDENYTYEIGNALKTQEDVSYMYE
jgi:hypothetical protein